MDTPKDRGLFIAGGICAIAWPILSEFVFFAVYPLVAGGTPQLGGPEGMMIRFAEAGQRPAVLALEWGKVAVQLLQLPFLLAVYRLLSERGQRNLPLVGVGLGLVSMVLITLSHTFIPTLSHSLGQAYVDAESPEEGAAILAVTLGLLRWRGGLNQTASLLYQGCVGLVGLAMIRSRTWPAWGWVGLIGALLALPANLPLGLRVPTNLIWTGLAYYVWPIAMGVKLLRAGISTPDGT
jgi:hypothetical protein